MSADDSVASTVSQASGLSVDAESFNVASKGKGKVTVPGMAELTWIAPSCCRAKFHSGDSDMVFICGNEVDCKRKGHKAKQETVDGRAVAGYYSWTRNNRFLDGIDGTYKSQYEYEALEKARLVGNRQAVEELTGKSVYVMDEEQDFKLPAKEMAAGRPKISSKVETMLAETVFSEDEDSDDGLKGGAPCMFPKGPGPSHSDALCGNLRKPTTKAKAMAKPKFPPAVARSSQVLVNTAGLDTIGENGGDAAGEPETSMAVANSVLKALEGLSKHVEDLSKRVQNFEVSGTAAAATTPTNGTTTGGGFGSQRKATLHALRSAAPGPYYAVAKGKWPDSAAVYSTSAEANHHVHGVSGAIMQSFPVYADADAFVKRYAELQRGVAAELAKRDAKEAELKEATAEALRAREAVEAEDSRAYKAATATLDSAATRVPTSAVPPPVAKLYGNDPSTGTPLEAFNVQLDGETEIRNGLAPEGLKDEDKKAMAMAMNDATALPGRSARSETEATTQIEDFTTALKVLAEGRSSSNPGVAQDTNWRSQGRTSLKGIASTEQLLELRDSIDGCLPTVERNMCISMSSVLSKYCWSKDLEVYWAEANLFTRVAKDSAKYYVGLLDHLLLLDRDQGWTYAKVALDYHAQKISEIRTTALNRLSAMVYIYVYLRDAKGLSFNAPKLQEKRNADIFERVAELERCGQVTHGPKCPKCRGSTKIHPAGKMNCPWKNSKDADARKQAAICEAAMNKHTPEE